MPEDDDKHRSQVGIGTLAVFIAMVLVAVLAGGVLLETTGLLQGKSAATSQQSSSQVTDRVGVESATASYSSGNMQRIDIVLSKAPGSGDIDLSEMVVHWLGPNGSSELTDSTFSITPIKGSGTVLEDRSDRLKLSNFGKMIPDGTPATVRFITADGGTTTVILRTPNAPPSDGAVSLLWQSPSGNPASGSGSATASVTATATATPTPTPTSPTSNIEWTYSGPSNIRDVEIRSGSSLYVLSNNADYNTYWIEKLAQDTGSVTEQYTNQGDHMLDILRIDGNDRAFVRNATSENVIRWDPISNTTSIPYTHTGDADDLEDLHAFNGDLYIGKESSGAGQIERRQTDNSLVWESETTDGGAFHIDTTSQGVYVGDGNRLEKWSHSGSQEWQTTAFSYGVDDVDTGNDTFAYVVAGLDVKQLFLANGTKTSFDYEASYVPDNVVTGPEGYVYIDDSSYLTVLDPSDGSVAYRREFSFAPQDIEVRSNTVYMTTSDETVVKLTLQGL